MEKKVPKRLDSGSFVSGEAVEYVEQDMNLFTYLLVS